jgi:hypothetical protein
MMAGFDAEFVVATSQVRNERVTATLRRIDTNTSMTSGGNRNPANDKDTGPRQRITRARYDPRRSLNATVPLEWTESCTSIDLVGAHRSGSDNQPRGCHCEQRRHDDRCLAGVLRDKYNSGEWYGVSRAKHARCTDSDI